jgi:hypothetical protein
MKPHKNPHVLPDVLAEIKHGSARSAILLASSLTEILLGGAIRHKMRPLTTKEQEAIFFGDGPLSRFSARIQIGYALNIYGKKTRHDLDALRQLRNQMAHSLEKLDFESLAAKLNGFHCIQDDNHGLPARELFAEIANRIALYLIWQIGDPDKLFGAPDAEYRRLIRHFD